MPEAVATQKTPDDFALWVSSCPKLALVDYVSFCFGRRKDSPITPWAYNDRPLTAQDLTSILCALGAFEPLGATYPRACDIVTSFDDIVEVPPATIDAEGNVVPSTKKLIKICAPVHRSLVVDFLEGIAANLTAWESGEVFSKALQVFGFSEMFCLPGEPGDGDDIGTFSNIRRIVLCPGSGFELSARNNSAFSPALFHVKAVMWTTCLGDVPFSCRLRTCKAFKEGRSWTAWWRPLVPIRPFFDRTS